MAGPIGLFEGQLAEITGLALEDTLSARYGGGKTPYASRLSVAGVTIAVAASPTEQITVYWAQALPAAASAASPALVTVRLGALVVYEGEVISHWEPYVGDLGDDLTVELSISTPTDVNMTYLKETPP